MDKQIVSADREFGWRVQRELTEVSVALASSRLELVSLVPQARQAQRHETTIPLGRLPLEVWQLILNYLSAQSLIDLANADLFMHNLVVSHFNRYGWLTWPMQPRFEAKPSHDYIQSLVSRAILTPSYDWPALDQAWRIVLRLSALAKLSHCLKPCDCMYKTFECDLDGENALISYSREFDGTRYVCGVEILPTGQFCGEKTDEMVRVDFSSDADYQICYHCTNSGVTSVHSYNASLPMSSREYEGVCKIGSGSVLMITYDVGVLSLFYYAGRLCTMELTNSGLENSHFPDRAQSSCLGRICRSAC